MKLSNIFAALAVAATAVEADAPINRKINAQVEDMPDTVMLGKTYQVKYSIDQKAKVFLESVERTHGTRWTEKTTLINYEHTDPGSHMHNWTVPTHWKTDQQYAIFMDCVQHANDRQHYDHDSATTKWFKVQKANTEKRFEA